jgi:hypothetical protein
MPNVDIHKQRAREPATGNPHKIIIALERRLDLFLQRISIRSKNLLGVGPLLLDGIGLIVQVMNWKIGCKEFFGRIAHINTKNVERPDFRIRPRTYCCDFAAFPIQRRKDKLVPNLIGFLWKIRLPACLATLLHRKTFRANALINKYRYQLTRSQRSFMFEKMIVQIFDVLSCDLEIGPVVCGNKWVANHYSAL